MVVLVNDVYGSIFPDHGADVAAGVAISDIHGPWHAIDVARTAA